MRLVTAQGEPLTLAGELGRGGEGAVHALRERADLVAKRYHQPPPPAQQAKLRWMAAQHDAALAALCAWPQHTLHARRGGPVLGFTMPRLSGFEPIHRVYGPLDRWALMPAAGWDALVAIGRALAAAFAALHARGHCVGDVNQGNVVVARDGRVRLIDADSFQIDARGTLHRCEVGVGHFTPPELQGAASFHGLTRCARHDDFGLALLLFHLLMGGRHPFAGVPLADAAADEPALEDDIRALRYAYAPDAARRGRRPPPRSVPMTLLPLAMQAMFTQAFTERGRIDRPTAAQWQAALGALHASLQRCRADPLHAYPPHLPTCPWCALAACGVIHFLPPALRAAGAPAAAELAALWARIEAVAPPPPLVLPPVPAASAATPLPADVPDARCARRWRALPLLFAAALLAWAPAAWPFVLLVALMGWLVAGSFITLPRLREHRRRQQALAAAQQAVTQLQARAEAEAGVAGFTALRARLARARSVCEARGAQPAARALRQRATVAARWQELQRGPQRLAAFAQAAAGRRRAHQAPLHAALRAVAQAERDLHSVEQLLR